MINTNQPMPTQATNISTQQMDQAPTAGALGDKSVTAIQTSPDALQLSQRVETAPESTLKGKVMSIVNSVTNFIKGLFSSNKAPVAAPSQQMTEAEIAAEMRKVALKSSLNGFSQLDKLSSLNGPELTQQHSELATGNGALRSTATALQAIKQFATPELHQIAKELLETDVAGHSFQQWATTGAAVSTFVQNASAEEMQAASEKLNLLSDQVSELKDALNRYLEPKQKISSGQKASSEQLASGKQLASSKQSASTVAARYEEDNDLGIGGGRSAKDNSKEIALDSVSYLSTRVAPSSKPTLSSDVINKLQDAFSNGDISFSMIQNRALNKGDLSLVRELALSTVAKQDTNYEGDLGAIIDSLSHTRPNVGIVMQGLQGFIETSSLQWHDKNTEKPEDALDANAHARFDESLMNATLDHMSTSDLTVALEQLEGDFGQRLRGILGLVAEKVPMSDLIQENTRENEVLISTATRFSVLVEGLMTVLREKLDQNTDVRFESGDFINDYTELTPIEKAALLRVGISEDILA